MVTIELKPHETGYEAVEEYIVRYYRREEVYGDVICSLGLSQDGEKWEKVNTLATYREYYDIEHCDVEFLNDWWEGQRFIRIFGIKAVEEIEVSGGIYED